METRWWRHAWRQLQTDSLSILQRDPAAYSMAEVWLCYPGLHALAWHRLVAHPLWAAGHRLLARWVAHWVRAATGIEIHPGATIGAGCFIDHGMGVVIGETAELGQQVTLYQGVTLGGTGKQGHCKRHPTLKDGVTVGAGAIVLGNIVIGPGASIGAGSVVVKDVSPGETVVGVPAHKMELLDDIRRLRQWAYPVVSPTPGSVGFEQGEGI